MNIWKALSLVFLTAALCACDSVSEAIDGGDKEKKDKHTVRIIDPAFTIDESTPDHLSQDTITVNNGESITVWPETWSLGGLSEVESVTGCGGLTYVDEVQHSDGSGTPEHWVTGPINSDCIVTITYRSLLPPFYLVKTNNDTYGGSIRPAGLTVIEGGSAKFIVEPLEGYKAEVTGCLGELIDGIYTVPTVSNNCSISATFSPVSPNQHAITISHTIGGETPYDNVSISHGETLTLPIYPGIGYTPDVMTTGCSGNLVDADIPYTEAYFFETNPIESDCIIDIVFLENKPDNTLLSVSFNKSGNHRVESIFFTESDESDFHQSKYASVPRGENNDLNQVSFTIYHDPGYEIVSASGCSLSSVFSNEYPARISVSDLSNDCEIDINLQASAAREIYPKSMRTHINNADENIATLKYTNGNKAPEESLCDGCPSNSLIHPRLWGTDIQFIVDVSEGSDFWFDSHEAQYCIGDVIGNVVTTSIDSSNGCQSIRVTPFNVN